MNYHFFIDEKFVNDFITDADKINEEQYFIVLSEARLKFATHKKVLHLNYGDKHLNEIISRIAPKDKLFVHWFSPKILDIINQLPRETKVFLMFWGADFLQSELPTEKNNFLNKFNYDPKTLSYIEKTFDKTIASIIDERNCSARKSKNIKNILHTHIQNFGLKQKLRKGLAFENEKELRKQFLKRISGVCHWNKYDIEFLENYYDVSLEQHYFIYNVGTSDLILSKSNNKEITIWLGNSDTPTNNHLDALVALEHFKNENIEIYCPLNYGNQEYGDIVQAEGERIFGKKFHALRDYIDRESYYALMDKVSIAIMYHNRGQAGGNIIAFLKKGVKVYLKDQSSISKLFKNQGIKIYSANDIKNQDFNEFIAYPDESEVNKNIELINAEIGNDQKRITALNEILQPDS